MLTTEDKKLVEDIYWAAFYKDRAWLLANQPAIQALIKKVGADQFVDLINKFAAQSNKE